MNRINAIPAIISMALAGCTIGLDDGTSLTEIHPDGAKPGSCWAKQIKPAVIQTETTQTAIPDDDGKIVYQTETTQTIVEERQEIWFEVPCQRVMSSDFIASVQRGLAARGFYAGPVTGKMDDATSKAIRLMQVPLGIDSQILSILGAQHLGLVTIPIK